MSALPENENNGASESDEALAPDSLVEDVGMLGIAARAFPPDMDFEYPDEPISLPPLSPEELSVEAKIRELEERLDGMMAERMPLGGGGLDPETEPVPESAEGDRASDEDVLVSAQELLTSDYYRKHWGRHALRAVASSIDDFGFDSAFEARVKPYLEFLLKIYFRTEVIGVDNIPKSGRAIVVANHSGALPFDGLMLRQAVRLHHSAQRDLRWLSEDFTFYLPFIGVGMNRLGAVRACQENAQRLLSRDLVVAAFPEGTEGIKKLYRDRYKLQRFGRGGFVRLALTTGSPIIPCAVIGGEETNPILRRFDNLSKLLGLEYLPITPTFPLLGPLGLLPAPTKWRILFGKPISVEEYGPEAATDHILVGQLSELVQSSIEELIADGLKRRKSVWF